MEIKQNKIQIKQTYCSVDNSKTKIFYCVIGVHSNQNETLLNQFLQWFNKLNL